LERQGGDLTLMIDEFLKGRTKSFAKQLNLAWLVHSAPFLNPLNKFRRQKKWVQERH
jgi:hypothetical protein